MLKILTEAFGPPGCEDDVRDIIKEYMVDLCDDIRIDSMGNLICHKKGKKFNNKSIILCSHMDEVAFIVSHITKDGYLKFQTIGGIDPSVLISKKVEIGRNRINGVIGVNPVHLKNDNNQKLKVSDLYIDIGANSADAASEYVELGDYICFAGKYTEFGDGCIKTKALDDRVGCYIMMNIAKRNLDADIYYVFTVQEELGCRGAKLATKNIDAEFAVVVESTTCADIPGIGKYGYITEFGKGPALSMRDGGTYADIKLTKEITEIAKKHNIPFQYKQGTMGGNDASALQISGKGTRVVALSVPCRYMHTHANVEKLDDILNLEKLLAAFIESKVGLQ